MTRVLLWDIDGTLLSTARAGVFALEQAARDVCGVEPDLATLDTAGLTDGENAAAVLEHCGHPVSNQEVARFLRAYERHLPERLGWREGRVLPGVVDLLDHIAGRDDVHSLLLTGNTPEGARIKLAHYGLDHHFDGGAFCHDLEDRLSIARRGARLAAERAGELHANSLVVIGDTPHDIRAGKEIGARTLAVASGQYSREELARCDPSAALDELPEPPAFAELVGIR